MTDCNHVRVRRDATWQETADGLVESSDGRVRLRIVARTDGMFDIVAQTATGTTWQLLAANRRKDADWGLRRLQEKKTPVGVAHLIEHENDNSVSREDCVLRSDAADETEQATLKVVHGP